MTRCYGNGDGRKEKIKKLKKVIDKPGNTWYYIRVAPVKR